MGDDHGRRPPDRTFNRNIKFVAVVRAGTTDHGPQHPNILLIVYPIEVLDT